MNNGLTVAGIIGATIGIILLAVVINPLIGALAGAVFGFFFNETATVFLQAIGMGNLEFWQFGAAVAFIGGFFRTVNSKSE